MTLPTPGEDVFKWMDRNARANTERLLRELNRKDGMTDSEMHERIKLLELELYCAQQHIQFLGRNYDAPTDYNVVTHTADGWESRKPFIAPNPDKG